MSRLTIHAYYTSTPQYVFLAWCIYTTTWATSSSFHCLSQTRWYTQPSNKDQKSNGTVGGGMNEGKAPVRKRTKQNTGATKEVGHANGEGSVTQRLRWIQNGSRNSRQLQNHVALEFVRAINNKSNLPSRVSSHNADYAQTDRFPLAKSWHFWKQNSNGLMHKCFNPSSTKGGPLRTPEGDFLWSCRNYIK